MSTEDEAKVLESDDSTIDYDKDVINSVEGLEKRKGEVKKDFYAENNHAHTQSFIQEAENVNYYINDMRPIKTNLSVDKTFNLCDVQGCINFVREFKETEYFYTAFVLLVFKKINVTDMRVLKELFLKCMANDNKLDDDNEKRDYIGPYVALESIVSVVGAEVYEKNNWKYVGFGNKRIYILKNMMEQFPDLQDDLVEFIRQLRLNKEFQTHFYTYQMVELIEELYLERIIAVKNKLLPILCTYKVNMQLLGMIFANLLQHKSVKSEVENILIYYLQSDNAWIWKSVLWGYIQSENEDDNFGYRMQSLIGSKIRGGKYKDYKFILELMMFSERFRDLICIVFEKEFFKSKTKVQRDELGNAFLYLLTNCYYRVNANHVELAFVICDKKGNSYVRYKKN